MPMTLDDLKKWFAQQGMPFEWRIDKGSVIKREATLLRDDPVDMGPYGLIVVLPDLHLGYGNDIFRYNSPSHAQRLDRFLEKLIELRSSHAVQVIQIGDLYDFYRVSPGASFDTACAEIERQYGSILAKLGFLNTRVSIGNHDAAFLRRLDHLASRNMLGAAAQTLAGSVFFHGAAIRSDINAEYWLRVVDTAATIPLVGPALDWIQRRLDGSLQDACPESEVDLPWPPWPVDDTPEDWDAPWVARSGATELVHAAWAFAEAASEPPPTLVFVGHSHRPGISCGQRPDGVWIPVIDVGSWTYGRAEFGVMGVDGIGLARLL